ncbi:MAG: hypothetical protein GVY19_06390 [Bacteroidetes bacterium]|jgi:cell fate regulator YaaT (PSP1 superfamily)|nr:hypothetical protein [Bacteroidota bacterium]
MGCSGCSARGFKTNEEEDVLVDSGCNKLDAYDWLDNIPESKNDTKFVEIRFKNTRKEYYVNRSEIPLKRGDIVAVEAQYGHDIGIVSLMGKLAQLQIKKRKLNVTANNANNVYRKATKTDINKWQEAQKLEKPTMVRARHIIKDLGLDMKLSEVEYQGDKTKATFYYIADDRVDFRELIKILADEFKIRIEMKQIGARQEAAMVGGIGSCGRELCCSTWKTNFNSVPTMAAKYQELSSNAQKLAGQCGKLKCCLMYELDNYLESWEEFPKELIELETEKGTYFPFKVDVLKKQVWYSSSKESATDLDVIDVKRIKEVINLNKHGELPVNLTVNKSLPADNKADFTNASGSEDVARFSNQQKTKKKHKNKSRHKNRNNRNRPDNRNKNNS